MSFPDTPADRYMRDPAFKVLVDSMVAAIQQCQYSPSEMREAALLASIRYESITLRTIYIDTAGNGSFVL